MQIGTCSKCGVEDFVAPFNEGLLCFDCMDKAQADELLDYAEPKMSTYPCHNCDKRDTNVIFVGLEQLCDDCFDTLLAEYNATVQSDDPNGFEEWVETRLLDKRIASSADDPDFWGDPNGGGSVSF